MLKLVDADEKYLDQYREAYILSLDKINKKLMKRHNLKFKNLDEVDIIQKRKDSRDVNKLKPGYVPSYDYFAVEDDKLIGVINIRTKITGELLMRGGHIGYGINPKYWQQGYGTELLKLGLDKAKEIVLDDNILITCDDDNIGSYRVIEKNGGVLENKVLSFIDGEEILTRRYWIKSRN